MPMQPVYLLQFPQNSRHKGYIYVESDSSSNYNSFQVRIKIDNDHDWEPLHIQDVTRYRDGGTTSIDLHTNNHGYSHIHVPTTFRNTEAPHVVINQYKYNLTRLNTNTLQFDTQNNPILPSIPQSSGTTNDFQTLYRAVSAILKPYGVSGNTSDIFEHTLLRLADVSFDPKSTYKWDESQLTPEYFFMDLSFNSHDDRTKFVGYMNKIGGEGTAEYTPKYNRNSMNAIRVHIAQFIKNILPAFEEQLKKTFSNLERFQFYVSTLNLDEISKKIQENNNNTLVSLNLPFSKKPTSKIVASIDTGFSKALFISGDKPELGQWKTAYRMEYNTATKQWVFDPSMHLQGAQFKFLIGAYDLGAQCDTSCLKWEEESNRTVNTAFTVCHKIDFASMNDKLNLVQGAF